MPCAEPASPDHTRSLHVGSKRTSHHRLCDRAGKQQWQSCLAPLIHTHCHPRNRATISGALCPCWTLDSAQICIPPEPILLSLTPLPAAGTHREVLRNSRAYWLGVSSPAEKRFPHPLQAHSHTFSGTLAPWLRLSPGLDESRILACLRALNFNSGNKKTPVG